MNREQADKLLAALLFDELDEDSRAALQAALEADADLREKLADLRMAAKVTTDALHDGPEPSLSVERYAALARLAGRNDRRGRRLLTLRRLGSVAAVVLVGVLGLAWYGVRARRAVAPADRPAVTGPALRAQRTGGRVAQATSGEKARPVYGLKYPLGYIGQMSADTLSAVRVPPGSTVRAGRKALGYAPSSAGDAQDVTVLSLGGAAPAGEPRDEVLERFEAHAAPRVDVDRRFFGQTDSVSQPESEIVGGATLTRPPRESAQVGLETAVEAKSLETDASGFAKQGMPSSGDLPELNTVFETRDSAAALVEPAAERPALGTQRALTHSRRPEPGGVEGPPAPVPDSHAWHWKRGGAGNAAAPASRLGKPVAGEGLEVEARLEDLDEAAEDAPAKPKRHSGRGRGLAGDRSGPAPTGGAAWGEAIPPVEGPVRAHGLRAQADKAGVQAGEDMATLPSSARFRVLPVNPWVLSAEDPLSTFALDVDRASYDLCARYLRAGLRPPAGAVRMEEFVNAFDYHEPQHSSPTFAVYTEAGPSPFAPAGRSLSLLKITVKARTVGRDRQRPAHLVLVVDSSASMGQADRLPAVQAALGRLVGCLSPADRVSLVTCSQEAALVLEDVSAGEGDRIGATLAALQTAGTTNLLAGLKLGYATARRHFRSGWVNHVVLCSDGVANVGQVEAGPMLEQVAADRAQGITLTTVGVGYGATNDALLEALANRGDGSYLYLDPSDAGQTQLVEHLSAAMHVVARDARIQVAFDPAAVRRYRLIGYENRDLADARFRDDTVDAGEVGSGQCATALYEVELQEAARSQPDAPLATVSVRFRETETGTMQEIARRLTRRQIRRRTVAAAPDFYLAAVVARFAEWLRGSEHVRGGDLSELHRVGQAVGQQFPLDRQVQELVRFITVAEHLPQAP